MSAQRGAGRGAEASPAGRASSAYAHGMTVDTTEMFTSSRVASTRGVEETKHALSRFFLPVDLPAARPGEDVGMRLNALLVGRVTCGYMRFPEAVRIQTVEARDYHIDIPVAGRSVMRAGMGASVYATPSTAGVFVPGRPVALDCGDGFAQISVMIPRDVLQVEVSALLGRDIGAPVAFSSELDLSASAGRFVLQTLQLIDGASKQQAGPLAHPLAVQRFEQVLLHSLLFAQPHTYSAELVRTAPSPGPGTVHRAVELLRNRPAHPWTVVELASMVSISVRSLQEGFRRTLDTTPMAYLQRRRLELAREDLRAATPETTSVTEVANRWGFVHLGRFAAVYRAAFSESPSATLRWQRT